MIVDVDLIVFNCVFSRAVTLNLCYIKDIISHIIVHIILFFEKKAPGRPGGFTQDAASAAGTTENRRIDLPVNVISAAVSLLS